MARVDQRWSGHKMCSYGSTHRGRCNQGDMLAKETLDLAWLLVRHEPKADFGRGPGRNDGLTARPLVAAADAVDGQRRANGSPLIKAITGLTPALQGPGIL